MTEPVSRLRGALAERYRIERELGQGGMATVYLAQDLKHDRRVAIKVLRPELAAVIGAERFLREIKTIATLQHPHILGLIDSGEVNGTAYYVMPFVEGESLRDRLRREKQLPIADAVRLATEVAAALDYAHRHGVIHRDIKPENILLHDGSALVADFGIALAVSSAGGNRMTETGMSLGTPHYMSPEQAMGEREITARSDVYALGCVTYEMLTGDPPFIGSTAQAIIAKVMTEKPAGIRRQRERVPDEVEDAVLTALEKLPADRFATAAEFAAALNGRAAGLPVRPTSAWSLRPRAPAPLRPTALLAGAVALVALGALAGWVTGHRTPASVIFLQRTFRSEAIYNARFAPDGRTVVYSSAAETSAPGLFLVRPDYPEPKPLGLTATHLLAVSSKGELAILVRAAFIRHRLFMGTLARVPLAGGAPREVLDSVREADWSPDGSELAIIHNVNGRDRLEFPIGTVLYQGSGYLSDPRVSPDGRHLAFAEHPFRWDDRGTVKILDRAGKTLAVTRDYQAIEGVAWRPRGGEVLFSSYDSSGFNVRAIDLRGRQRVALTGAGNLTIQDISRSGQLVLTRDDAPYRLLLRAPGAARELDVSWLDASIGPKLSRDGSLLAFTNGGFDASVYYDVMLRKTEGGEVARLGEGQAADFSPDGKWLLAFVSTTPAKLVLYPTRAGAERRIAIDPFEAIGSADWFPDGRSILFCGNRVGEASRCWVQPLEGGKARAVTPAGTDRGLVSPDGGEIVAFSQSLGYRRYPVAGGSGRAIPGLSADDRIARWSMDGRALVVGSANSPTMDRVDLATGRREPLVTLGTEPPGPRSRPVFFAMADNPRVYAYVAATYLSQVFTVDGVR
jgi:Tol biopolymer transport system component/tRNA A-37 threonylcarbamoyl transferase component Bud32